MRRDGSIDSLAPIAAGIVFFAALSQGCSSKLSGPGPQATALEPSLACVEQLVTEITISGDHLSPLPFDTLTDEPHLAIPDVMLRRTHDLNGAVVSDPPVQLSNDPYAPGTARVRWVDQTTMAFDVYPELGLTSGLYSVTVTNRNGEAVTLEAAMAAVDRPEITSVIPDLVCIDEGSRDVVLSGTGFLRVGDALPTVTFGTVVLPVSSVDDCIELGGPTAASVCQTARVTIPRDALVPGAPALVMTNPSPAGCRSMDAPPISLAVVAAPTLESVVPDLICDAESSRSLTLTGTGFVKIGATLPAVTFGTLTLDATSASGCMPISGTLLPAEACTELIVVVPQNGLPAGVYDVSVENPEPAGCSTQEAVTLVVVPPPDLDSVVPDLVCDAQGGRTIVLNGTGFVTIGATMPGVDIGGVMYTPTSASGCTPLAGTLLGAASCTSLTVNIAQNDLAPGTYDVVVTNPGPAGCSSSPPVPLVVVPPPQVDSVVPDFACNAGESATFAVSGSGFLIVDGVGPTVTLGTSVFPTTTMGGCVAVPGPTETVQACTSFTFSVPAGTLAPGQLPFVVTNPAPAGCASTQPILVGIAPPPEVVSVAPAAICTAQGDVTLTLTGTGFLSVDGVAPTVTVGATAVTASGMSGCTQFPSLTNVVNICTTLTAVFPMGSVPPGARPVIVTNPAPAACSSAPVILQGTDPPTLATVAPSTMCRGGGILDLTGTNFAPGMTARVGTVTASNVGVTSSTRATAVVGAGLPLGGPYPVTISNGDGCSATLPDAVTVVDGPLLVFVNPPVVWNGTATPVTVFATGVGVPVTNVSIVRTGSGDPLTSLAFSPAPGHPDRPNAVVPAGTAPGTYDVLLTDSTGCPAVLSGALRVTDTTTLQLTSILPSFGWTGSTTSVDIGALPSPGFGPLPIVYLTNASLGAPVVLGSVARVSATSLTADVPDGLAPGAYDVVVVNQDGSVGVLANGFTVTANPPPLVSSISPSQVVNTGTAQPLTINGTNFRAAPLGLPQVVLRCRNPLGTVLADETATVSSFDSVSINATFNASIYTSGANCIVVVTNTDDSSRTEFSSLVVVTPSQNLTNFIAGPSMITGRSGLAAVSGGASQQSRFVYAIAGDDGNGTLDSVESLPVDIFGLPGARFFAQRNRLNTARTRAGAVRIGRFIYVLGGTSTSGVAAGALATVERAAILDQTVHPGDLDVDLNLSPVDGLSNGVFYYRVSAVMPAGDPFNPGGETLPSSPFGLNLPNVSGMGLRVTLTWTPVPGAVGYRIYRTTAGGSPDSAGLIADTTGALPATVTCSATTTCTDLGATPTPSSTVLPLGSTGTWTTLTQTMGSTRQAPGVTFAIDPADPTRAHIYVFGGLDATGTALASYEFLTIQVNGNGSQTVLGFTTGTAPLTAARWRLGAYTVAPTDTPLVGANTYVWAGGGAAASGAMVSAFDGGQVTAGGQLASLTNVGPMNPPAAGYGAFAAGDLLYAFGGQNGLPDTNNMSAEHSGAPPGLVNFQGFTPGLTTARVNLGAALQSGYFYVLGGTTTGNAVTNTIEYVLY